MLWRWLQRKIIASTHTDIQTPAYCTYDWVLTSARYLSNSSMPSNLQTSQRLDQTKTQNETVGSKTYTQSSTTIEIWIMTTIRYYQHMKQNGNPNDIRIQNLIAQNDNRIQDLPPIEPNTIEIWIRRTLRTTVGSNTRTHDSQYRQDRNQQHIRNATMIQDLSL